MDLKATLQRKKPAQAVPADDPVQVARQRARYRLLGAAVLLVLGIVGFPWLFDNRPRPLSLDTPVVATAKVQAELPARAARPASAPAIDPNANLEAESSAPAEPAPPVVQAAAPVATPPVASAPAATAAARPVSPETSPLTAPSAAAGPASASKAAGAASTAPAQPVSAPAKVAAAAALAGAVAAATSPRAAAPVAAPAAPPSRPAAAEQTGRFVVQVGAFTDAAAIRETRQKVERLGLKTYTQVVDTDAGKRTRVRVGPFATREAADQALARLKKASLPGTVLTL